MTKTGVVKKSLPSVHSNTVSEFVNGYTHTIHVDSCQSEQLVAKSENGTKVIMKLVISTKHVDEYKKPKQPSKTSQTHFLNKLETSDQNGGC